MNVILAHRTINQLYLLHLTQLLQDFYDILPYLPIHNLPPIFRYENYVVRAIPTCMLYTLIIHMDTSLLNSNGLRNLYYSNTGGFYFGALGNASACPGPPALLGDLYVRSIKVRLSP